LDFQKQITPQQGWSRGNIRLVADPVKARLYDRTSVLLAVIILMRSGSLVIATGQELKTWDLLQSAMRQRKSVKDQHCNSHCSQELAHSHSGYSLPA
jgi:hypothetical protein